MPVPPTPPTSCAQAATLEDPLGNEAVSNWLGEFHFKTVNYTDADDELLRAFCNSELGWIDT